MSLSTRTHRSIIAFLAVAIGLLVTGNASPQDTQPTSPAPSDTVFNDIRLSGEGVVAIDTSGFTWHYDFESDQFVRGVKKSETSPKDDPFDELLNTPPVEQRCTEQIEVVTSKKSVQVRYDEYVEGDINTLGRVTIKGWVKGDVQSHHKRVIITETGQVDGDVKAPSIVIKEGGLVLGKVIETEDLLDFRDLGIEFSPDGIIVVLSFICFLLIIGFLTISLMPKQLEVVRSCMENNKLRTYSLGFLFILLIPVIAVLLIITILGIALIPILLLAYIAAMVIGIISFGGAIGARLTRLVSGSEGGLMVQSMTGILLFMGLWMVVAVLMGSSGEVANGLGIAALVISILISTYPVCAGVGASLLTRFGFKKYVSWKDRRLDIKVSTEGPAPPPIPNVPGHENSDQATEPGK